MDNRRRNGAIALVVLATAVVALIYTQMRPPVTEPTTAFAPAQSADESVAPDETPIMPPADVAAAPADGEGEPISAEAAAIEEGEPAAAADDVAAATDAAPVAEPEAETAEAPVDTIEPAEVAAAGESEAGGEPATGEGTAIAMIDPGAAEPEAAAPPAAEAIVIPESGVPTFDIVRVEPSGETVIAGQAEPNAVVEILDAGTVIATAEANEGGDWAIALDAPLEPGTHDLAIQTTTPEEEIVMLSDQRVTVSVPEDDSGEVLVLLNEPGTPSTLIQVPPATVAELVVSGEAQEEAAVADAVEEPQAAGEDVAAAETALAAPEAEEDAMVADAPAAETPETTVALAPEGTAPEPSATESETETADAAPEDVLAGSETAVAAAPVEEPAAPESDVAEVAPEEEAEAPAIAVVEPEAPDTEPEAIAEAEAEAVAEPEAEVADAEAGTAGEPAEVEIAAAPAVEEPPAPPPPPEPMVSVAAVEAEMDGSLFVAGLAATGETVRVYLDDKYIGDAVPSPTGTWLVESTMDLPAGDYIVRVDQLGADGTVIARSEVPFEREVEVAILRPTASAAAVADAASLSGAMPELETVIIKRGDNLWRIARANWGKGIRWSVIYQANTDQIRNPNRIYPGQVFVVPKGDVAWEN